MTDGIEGIAPCDIGSLIYVKLTFSSGEYKWFKAFPMEAAEALRSLESGASHVRLRKFDRPDLMAHVRCRTADSKSRIIQYVITNDDHMI